MIRKRPLGRSGRRAVLPASAILATLAAAPALGVATKIS